MPRNARTTGRTSREQPGNNLEVNLTAFKSACMKAIRDAIGNINVGLTPKEQGPFTISFQLTASNQTSGEARYMYPVIPLRISNDQITFWLAVNIDLARKPSGMYQVQNICVLLFKADNAGGEKTPLLRAEWSLKSEDALVPHAQPHWHVYSSAFYSESAKFESGSSSNMSEVREFSSEISSDSSSDDYGGVQDVMAKFHFAMFSEWHKNKWQNNTSSVIPHHAQVEDANRLPDWLESCIRYILYQVTYLYGK